ncbi:hypothetical protein MACJ_003201 [Theileria orientalis]|uniref:Uncharacterized protein n=1 Tax=Theileria orientalis TaxID=68886 RepID=A0A976QSY5_THEOR|nr:hypothetical protein MACJ_003201 [Theileria orientalis]
MASAKPTGKDNDTASLRSSSTVSSVVSSIIPRSIISSTQNTNSVNLDFDASEVTPDLVVNTSIPGVIKYSAANNKMLDRISGRQQTLEFTKEINHVLSNSPFNGNITVVFHDSTTEQYFLQTNGFVKVIPEAQKTQSQQSSKIETHTLLDLDLNNPSAQFSVQEVGNIKCYKPKGSRELVSKIIIGDANRNVEHHVKENFICYTLENGRYSILVAYLNTDNKWLNYTLSKQATGNILMDVSLMRTFDEIDMSSIFADHSTPYDTEVFSYENLKVNKNDVGKFISQRTGNLKFFLEVRDPNGKIEKINVVFDKHFIIDEGFKFHSIRSKSNYEQMMFTYVNDNVVHHEKYIKRGNVYKKDLNAVNKHDLKRTKTIIGRENINDENVLFYTTIVPDALHQGIEISHHGRYKVFDFNKGKDRFVIFPNMEFYLSKDQDHRLILCENGESVNLVMKTTSENKRVDYIATTDPMKGNPLAIKALLRDFEFTQKRKGGMTVVEGPQHTPVHQVQHAMQALQGGSQPTRQQAPTSDYDDIAVVEGPAQITHAQPVEATPQVAAPPVTAQASVTQTAPVAPRKKSVDSDDDISVVEGPMGPPPPKPQPQQLHEQVQVQEQPQEPQETELEPQPQQEQVQEQQQDVQESQEPEPETEPQLDQTQEQAQEAPEPEPQPVQVQVQPQVQQPQPRLQQVLQQQQTEDDDDDDMVVVLGPPEVTQTQPAAPVQPAPPSPPAEPAEPAEPTEPPIQSGDVVYYSDWTTPSDTTERASTKASDSDEEISVVVGPPQIIQTATATQDKGEYIVDLDAEER